LFWRKLENSIRQNKKESLLKFLFGTYKSQFFHPYRTKKFNRLGEKIQSLENGVNFLKQKLQSLEANQN
jgi:hypothetical protein